MPSTTINPTRMQFMDVVRENRALRRKVEESLMRAHGSFTVAAALMSPEMLEPVPAREPESTGNLLTLTCLEDQIDHVDGVTLAISNDMGVLLRKMLENLEEYDDPPVLTRVEKTISGFLFAYGGRDNQEDGPCVVYIVLETPVLPAKNKEEMK